MLNHRSLSSSMSQCSITSVSDIFAGNEDYDQEQLAIFITRFKSDITDKIYFGQGIEEEISLLFEKTISTPQFSQAYAKLCKEMSNSQKDLSSRDFTLSASDVASDSLRNHIMWVIFRFVDHSLDLTKVSIINFSELMKTQENYRKTQRNHLEIQRKSQKR